jgi:ABC-2 type transport system ATP-binding protein
VLVSSHVLTEMQQLADDVVIIARGRIVTQGGVGEVVGRAGGAVRVRSPQRDRLLEALRRAGLESAPLDENGLSVRESSPSQVGEIAAAEGIVLHELVAEEATLEEVFLELTQGAAYGAGLRSAGFARAPSETTGRDDRRQNTRSEGDS